MKNRNEIKDGINSDVSTAYQLIFTSKNPADQLERYSQI